MKFGKAKVTKLLLHFWPKGGFIEGTVTVNRGVLAAYREDWKRTGLPFLTQKDNVARCEMVLAQQGTFKLVRDLVAQARCVHSRGQACGQDHEDCAMCALLKKLEGRL